MSRPGRRRAPRPAVGGSRRVGASALAFACVATSALSTAPAQAAASPSPSAAAAGSTPERPNVVMVVLDDLNPHDGRLWSPEVMPNLAELITSRGIRFTDFHAEAPLCGPSRANLLTAQHTHNSGARSNDGQQLDPRTTIATALSEAGYHTSLVGKYLNGYHRFTDDRRDPPGWSEMDVIDANQGKYFWYHIRDRDGNRTKHLDEPEDYSTDVIADLAARRIREAPDGQPLFQLIAPFTPHVPNEPAPRHVGDPRCADLPRWAPPNYDEADVSDKPPYIQALEPLGDGGFDLRAHCESLLAVDDLIGRVGKALDREDRLEDTVFVFTADNGMGWGEHRQVGKAAPYTTAVPAYVAWPAGRGTTPRDDATTLSMIDWGPTLCELAGCELGPYPDGQVAPDGLSFAALLHDQPYPWIREAILHTIPSGGQRNQFRALRTTSDHPLGRWLYVENTDGFRELYDLDGGPCHAWQAGAGGDPCLLENALAGDAPANVAALAESLSAELAALSAEVAPEPVRRP